MKQTISPPACCCLNAGETSIDRCDASAAHETAAIRSQIAWVLSRAGDWLNVNQEPGSTFEANGILHPRVEDFQLHYVIDSVP
jgi:hypothetical protein